MIDVTLMMITLAIILAIYSLYCFARALRALYIKDFEAVRQAEQNLRQAEQNLRQAVRENSWAKIRHAQSSFNVDFLDELYANNDPRLTQ